MDEALLEAHADLRLRALERRDLFTWSDRARAHVIEKLTPIHRDGRVRIAEARGRVVAVLAWRHDPEPWYGEPVSSVALDYDLGWEQAGTWLGAVLDEELPRMKADLDLLLDTNYREAYRALRARGIGLDSLQLFGRPARALERLLADRDVPRDLSRWGVTIEPLGTDGIDAVLELSRETFAKEPQYCWFGANEAFLRYKRAELERDLACETHVQRAIVQDGRIVGHCSASVRADDPLWGPIAGLSLNLAPELRGRGMLRSLYRHLLEAALERGARAMKGGTSQPPVIKLAALMDRDLHALVLRRRANASESHFAPYLPLS